MNTCVYAAAKLAATICDGIITIEGGDLPPAHISDWPNAATRATGEPSAPIKNVPVAKYLIENHATCVTADRFIIYCEEVSISNKQITAPVGPYGLAWVFIYLDRPWVVSHLGEILPAKYGGRVADDQAIKIYERLTGSRDKIIMPIYEFGDAFIMPQRIKKLNMIIKFPECEDLGILVKDDEQYYFSAEPDLKYAFIESRNAKCITIIKFGYFAVLDWWHYARSENIQIYLCKANGRFVLYDNVNKTTVLIKYGSPCKEGLKVANIAGPLKIKNFFNALWTDVGIMNGLKSVLIYVKSGYLVYRNWRIFYNDKPAYLIIDKTRLDDWPFNGQVFLVNENYEIIPSSCGYCDGLLLNQVDGFYGMFTLDPSEGGTIKDGEYVPFEKVNLTKAAFRNINF